MDLMEVLAQAAGESKEDAPSLTDVQVVARLRDVFDAMQEVHTFSPGDVLLHKWPEMATTRGAAAPVLFVKYLPRHLNGWDADIADPKDLFNTAATAEMDCMVLHVVKGRAVPHLSDSQRYRPHPDFGGDA